MWDKEGLTKEVGTKLEGMGQPQFSQTLVVWGQSGSWSTSFSVWEQSLWSMSREKPCIYAFIFCLFSQRKINIIVSFTVNHPRPPNK